MKTSHKSSAKRAPQRDAGESEATSAAMPPLEALTYSPDELRAMLEGMGFLSTDFYRRAVQLGNHAFIEFAGLMNEYIKLCREALEAGDDFTRMNAHTGLPLPMKPYHADYLGEKMECIFGASLIDPPNLAAFLVRLIGRGRTVALLKELAKGQPKP